MRKLSKKHKIIISVVIILVAFIVYAIYYLFLPKKYTFYINENIGEVSAVRIDCDGYNKGGIYVYDEELIDEIFETLEDVKIAPYYSLKMADDKKNFWVDFIVDNKLTMGINGIYDEDEGIYEVYLDVEGDKHLIWDFVGRYKMDKETGDKIHKLVSERYIENIRNISVTDILKLSGDAETDLFKFFQFQYEEIDNMADISSKVGLDAEPARFDIEGKKGYVIVWYVYGSISNKDGRTDYSFVEQAKVYNEKGEEIDFYDEGIEEFLEAME